MPEPQSIYDLLMEIITGITFLSDEAGTPEEVSQAIGDHIIEATPQDTGVMITPAGNVVEPFTTYKDALERAWGIIANAYEGIWADATPEWREASEAFRDAYLNDLGALDVPDPEL